jgi:hypothetical protein
MADLQCSVVTLRIVGDDLIPEEITTLLGVSPSSAQLKGEKMIGRMDAERTAEFGMWRFHVAEREPGDIDGQIGEIFGQMTGDLAVWQGVTKRYKVDLFCGLFLKGSNEGLTLSPKSLAALGERGITMGLDIYSNSRNDGTLENG